MLLRIAQRTLGLPSCPESFETVRQPEGFFEPERARPDREIISDKEPPMPPAMRVLVPMASVKDVTRSVEFYRKLGFEVGNDFAPPGQSSPSWAWLASAGGAQLMVSRATEPAPATPRGVLFYLYCDDVAATHAQLGAAGLAVGEIKFPFYAPRGEFELEDPDGWVLMITHT
jgi:catechol 2,3-dioxygenase-like lactoylglutathione lyase family enzyme